MGLSTCVISLHLWGHLWVQPGGSGGYNVPTLSPRFCMVNGMGNDGWLKVRLPAADLDRLNELVAEGDRSRFVRNVLCAALDRAAEDQLAVTQRDEKAIPSMRGPELVIVDEPPKPAMDAAEQARWDRVARMRKNQGREI